MFKDFFFIAGPCLVESHDLIFEVAEKLSSIKKKYNVPIILKGSFKKANRTSISGVMTTGTEESLTALNNAGKFYDMPTLTDVHTESDAILASKYVDVLQIPAFLSRQTELIQTAAKTGKWVNIKKGQFMAPDDMKFAVEKVKITGHNKVMICERGSSFGYHNLVVDMRGLIIMRESGVPVIYDATHSLQLPSGENGKSGGNSEYVLPLARAAVSVGVNGVFFETHPNPVKALSDSATQLDLKKADQFVEQILDLNRLVKSFQS